MKKLISSGAVALAALTVVPAAASAATITVNSPLDDGAGGFCTLREAVENANSDAVAAGNGCTDGNGNDTINFSPATFPLGGAQEAISLGGDGKIGIFDTTPNTLDIVHPGFNELAINGPTIDQQIFDVFIGQTVTMSGLTLQNAVTDVGGDVAGGAIFNAGNLTLEGMFIRDNQVTGTALATDVYADGGGIYNHSFGTLTLDFSVVAGNSATASNTLASTAGARARGGGIYSAGALHIHNSAIDDNHTVASDTLGVSTAVAEGGGVRTTAGTMDADHSSFIGNTADATVVDASSAVGANGAGIMAAAAQLELVTIAQNTTDASGGLTQDESGAGLVTYGAGTTNLISSTVAENGPDPAAASSGPNVYAAANVNLANTIVASPAGGSDNCFGTFTSSGYNIEFPSPVVPSCSVNQPTDLTSNPLLDPAGPDFFGGFTADYPLLPGSPAIDSGTAQFQLTGPAPGVYDDQRGDPRPVDFPSVANLDDGSDRGAVEEDPAVPPVPGPPGPAAAGPTGLRAAALKRCAKVKNKKKKKRCKQRARRLPV